MSSSTSELETTTETRTKVDTEEVTLYECPAGCGQHVEREELVPVKVGEGDDQVETIACEYCARSQYGFDADPSTQSVPEQIGETADSFADVVAIPLAKAIFPLAITALPVVAVANELLSSIQSMSLESEQATVSMFEIAGETMGSLLATLPMVFVAVLMVYSIFRLMVIGPRM
jgi:hypothetical protein